MATKDARFTKILLRTLVPGQVVLQIHQESLTRKKSIYQRLLLFLQRGNRIVKEIYQILRSLRLCLSEAIRIIVLGTVLLYLYHNSQTAVEVIARFIWQLQMLSGILFA